MPSSTVAATAARASSVHAFRLGMVAHARSEIAAGRYPSCTRLGSLVGRTRASISRHIDAIRSDPAAYPGGWPGDGVPASMRAEAMMAGAEVGRKAIAARCRSRDESCRSRIAGEATAMVARGESPTPAAIGRAVGMSEGMVRHYARQIERGADDHPGWPGLAGAVESPDRATPEAAVTQPSVLSTAPAADPFTARVHDLAHELHASGVFPDDVFLAEVIGVDVGRIARCADSLAAEGRWVCSRAARDGCPPGEPTPAEIAEACRAMRDEAIREKRASGGGGSPGESPRMAKERAGRAGVVVRWKGSGMGLDFTH